MQLEKKAEIMQACARHIRIIWELKTSRWVSMTDLARKLSVQNPKSLSRPLNDLQGLGLVEHWQQENPRGGIKLKFWSLSPRAERLLAPFWRENEETLKPIAPSGKKIEITKADPSEVQYYLGKVLDRKQKQLVHSEAMRGLLAVCREHHLPLGEGQYADILKGFRVLLENHSTSKDVRDDLLRALEAIEYNSFSIGDKETIVCIRDNFLERLEELQRVDPWRATPPLDYLLSEDERLGIYQDLVRNWMEDVVDDESYLMNLQCLLPHLTVMYKNKLKEVREWLFGLMDSANERISSRAANLHRTLT